MSYLELLPAVDVKDGKIVHDGNYGYEVKYAQGNNIFNDHKSVLLDKKDLAYRKRTLPPCLRWPLASVVPASV